MFGTLPIALALAPRRPTSFGCAIYAGLLMPADRKIEIACWAYVFVKKTRICPRVAPLYDRPLIFERWY